MKGEIAISKIKCQVVAPQSWYRTLCLKHLLSTTLFQAKLLSIHPLWKRIYTWRQCCRIAGLALLGWGVNFVKGGKAPLWVGCGFSLLHPILAEPPDNLTSLTNHQHFPLLLSEYHPLAKHCALELSQYELCRFEENIDSIVTGVLYFTPAIPGMLKSAHRYPAPSWIQKFLQAYFWQLGCYYWIEDQFFCSWVTLSVWVFRDNLGWKVTRSYIFSCLFEDASSDYPGNSMHWTIYSLLLSQLSADCSQDAQLSKANQNPFQGKLANPAWSWDSLFLNSKYEGKGKRKPFPKAKPKPSMKNWNPSVNS